MEGAEADPAGALAAQVGVGGDDLDDVRRLLDPLEAVGRDQRHLGPQNALLGHGQLGEAGDAVAVGHPRQVIGDALGVVRPRLALRRLLRVLHVVVEEAAQGALDPLLLVAGGRPQVDAVEHELAQAQHRAADLLALDDVRRLGGRVGDDVADQGVDPGRAGRPEQLDLLARQVAGPQDAGAQGVVDVVVDVGDAVDQLDDPPLEGRRLARARCG